MTQPRLDAPTSAPQPHLPPRPLDTEQSRAATHPVTERRKHRTPLGWLPWALLAALLALLLVLALVALTTGGGDGTSSSGSAASGTSQQDATSGGSGSGALSAGGVSVLQDSGTLSRFRGTVGETATGRDVRVQEVVADEGFWVGSSEASRVFVYLSPQARQSAGESGFQVRAGQSVDLTGTVNAVRAGDPARFGVTSAEGSRQLASQGAYVNASRVSLSS